MKSRIKPIDGLRAFAAFGVVWIHSWISCNNPAFNLFSIDIYKSIVILGNGVDFFFVISGFCMYLMIDKNSFSKNGYLHFLSKRFLRIAPAFFVSVIVYAMLIKMNDPSFSFWYSVIFHFLFLNNVVPGVSISGPFWSIGVEWHFYMVLPVVIWLAMRISIIKTTLLCSIISIIFYCYTLLDYFDVAWWESQVFIRFPEFGCGIIAAALFLKDKKLPRQLAGYCGLLLGLIMMYLGRVMMFTPFLEKMAQFAFIFKALSYTVMTAGFAFILFHVITIRSLLSRLLSCSLLVYLGRISYSIYLWHSLSFILLWRFIGLLNFGAANVLIVFTGISLLTIGIAHFSYKYLESFYFKKDSKVPGKIKHLYAK